MKKQRYLKVRLICDVGEDKQGTILYMKESDAMRSVREKEVEILGEAPSKREKEAKYYRDKFVMDGSPGTTYQQATAPTDKFFAYEGGIGVGLGVSRENYLKLSSKGNHQQKLIKKYLKKKNIFEHITEVELDKQIVGEIPTRKVIFLCSQGKLVENCQIASYNLMINSTAGAGKDYITSKVLSILPENDYVKKTRITPMAFTYWHNSKFEPDWTWDGKVCYLEDISEQIFNHEVFKVMTSSGSSATVVIKQKAYEIDVRGKPVMITTTATATPIPELARRFEFCNLDEGINQTEEIMKRHAEFAVTGVDPNLNPEITEALKCLKRVKVRIPYANKLHKYFPPNNLMMRTKFPRFLDFIKASCAFHQYQRKKDKNGFFLAQKKDYELAKICIKKLSSNRFLVPLTLNQQKIMSFFDKNESFFGYLSTISNKMGSFLTKKHLQNNLNLLVSYGLLEKTVERDSQNRDTEYFKLSSHLKGTTGVFDLPSFEFIVGKKA